MENTLPTAYMHKVAEGFLRDREKGVAFEVAGFDPRDLEQLALELEALGCVVTRQDEQLTVRYIGVV